MKKTSARYHATLLIMIVTILLTACGQGKTLQEEVPVAPELPEIEQQAEKPEHVAPLTGMPLEEPATGRPFAVMINNMSKARPQSGLTHADIVYEVLAEGGITRLIAIYQSDEQFEGKIGPIRSIRPYLIDIGESYNGVLVHAGGSPDAYAILQKQRKDYMDEITNAGNYYWRDKSRKAPHNLYSDLAKLKEGAEKKKYAQDAAIPAYPFLEEDSLPSGEEAKRIELQFLLKNYRVSYEYDEETKLYKRYIDGKPHIDLETEEQLTATNLVVLGADHKTLDDVGRLAINLEQGGEAVLFQRGKMIECRWSRAPGDIIRISKDGRELPFYPGKTYYHIVPNSPTFDSHIVIPSSDNEEQSGT